VFDEILDLFDRRKRRPETDRSSPSRGVFGELFGDENDDGPPRDPHGDGRRDASRRDRSDRRDSVEDWD
jgi:hypothetical protein